VGELGDLLELMYGARGRWRTLRATTYGWGHHERARAAFQRYSEQRDGSQGGGVIGTMVREGPAPPVASEHLSRVWIDRVGEQERSETDGEGGGRLNVRSGSTWWSFRPETGVVLKRAEPGVGGPCTDDLGALLDPSFMLADFEFVITGTGHQAGRPVLLVSALPRPYVSRRGVPAHVFPGAEEVLLAVDAERGLLLRREARLAGEPFSVGEFVEIAFDEELDDDLFVFVPPDGNPVR
jgi:outer membrane lipoprotein-sorting protein